MSGKTQFGFKGGLGTREAEFCLNTKYPMKGCLPQFLDYRKTSHNLKHDIIMELPHKVKNDQPK